MAEPSAPSTPTPAGRGRSLRLQLNLIVAALMGLFIAALVWLQIDNTRDSVRDEITGSNKVATQLLERVSGIFVRGGPPAMLAFLEQLGRVRANEIVLLNAEGRELYRSPPATYKQGRSAPEWFTALVVPPLQRQHVRMPGATLMIESNPSRAILDGWDNLTRLAGIAAVTLLFLHAAVFWAVGHTLRPFSRIVEGLRRLQAGDYATRLPALPGREAALIGEAVNQLGDAIETTLQQRIAAHQAQQRLSQSQDWARHVEERLEAERKEIAAELHDELGQSVTAIRSLARSLAARLPEADATGREAAQLIDSEAARLYDAMHGMIPRLTPLALGPLGLPDALRDLVASLRQRHPGFQFSLQVLGADTPVDAATALVAYRTAQEALNNAIKHSRAAHLDLVLVRDTHTMTLTLTDDGCGLPPPGERPERFGLAGLRERAEALGGDFVAERRPEGGTRVSVRLPCQAPADLRGQP